MKQNIYNIYRFLFIFGFIITGCQCFSSPVLKIPVIDAHPVIDGNIDKGEWQDAACASGFISTNQEWPLQQTSAYIAINGQYLYFAFKCQSLGVDKIKAKKYEKDSKKIFGEDSVELFLAPELAGNTYYQIAFNATGSSYTAKYGNKRDVDWEPKLKIATGTLAKSWIIEGRLPLKAINAKNTIAEEWRVNFARNYKISKKNSSSWTGQANFHDKKLMGSAKIVKSAFVDYSLESLDAISGVQVKLRNNKLKKYKCKVEVTSPGEECIYSCFIDSRRNKNIFSGPLLSIKNKIVTLKISGDDFKYQKSAFLPYYKKFSIRPEFYYFTPPTHKVEVKVNNQIENSSGIKISLHPSGGESPLRQMRINASETNFSIDLQGFPCGRYILSADLLEKNGKSLVRDDKLIFIKEKSKLSALPEKQNFHIRDSVFFMNNKPFFPFMISTDCKAKIPACFNVKFVTKGGKLVTEGVKKNAPARGGSGVTRKVRRKPILLYEFPDEKVVRKQIIDCITKKSNIKNLYRNIQYEAQIPPFRVTKDGLKPFSASAEYFKIYNFIKKISPKELTSIQVDRLKRVKEFVKCADIIEVASYGSSYAWNPLKNLSADIKFARKQVGNKPLVWWIGASIPTPDARTAENIRAASYLAIMNGVNGIIYHNGHGAVPTSRTRMWSVFSELSYEIEFLYSIIVLGKKVEYKNLRVKPSGIKYVMRYHEGALFIIALNTSAITLQGTFFLPPEIYNREVKVLFENREIKIKKRIIEDNFTPYEPHVYIIKQQ